MTIEEHISYWIESADQNLKAAQDNLNIGHNDWCLFISHLAIEKLLKAIFIKETKNLIPPKIHNLVRLAELSNIILTTEQKKFLDIVSEFNLESRYPDDKFKFYKLATREFTFQNFNKIKEYFSWLKSQIK
jgi:HEPN domain-containing protein